MGLCGRCDLFNSKIMEIFSTSSTFEQVRTEDSMVIWAAYFRNKGKNFLLIPLRATLRTSDTPYGRNPFGTHKNETAVCVHSAFSSEVTMDILTYIWNCSQYCNCYVYQLYVF